MSDERDTDRRIESWLRETPPGPPDRDAVYARTLDRLPETRRSRRWSLPQLLPLQRTATRRPGASGDHRERRYRRMLAPLITASLIAGLGGGLLFWAAAPGPGDDTAPAAEGLSAAQALDDRMLEVLNEPDGTRINDLAAEVFTEDATFTMVWGPDEVDLDPDRLHITGRFFDPMTATRIGSVVELPATVEGDSRYVGVYDFMAPSGTTWPGTVCASWAHEGSIYRLDCLFPEPLIAEVTD